MNSLRENFAFYQDKLLDCILLEQKYGSPKIDGITIFLRLCNHSEISHDKERPSFFDKELCFQNLLATIDCKEIAIIAVLDTFYGSKEDHFIVKYPNIPIIEIKEGNEAGAFLRLLEIIEQQDFSPDRIVYILEDDYLHRSGWVTAMQEAFLLPCIDYVTLYDHRDKYEEKMYEELKAKILYTKSCHWRTTPSTTNTYAMRFQTFQKHLPIHRKYSENVKVSKDHAKFLELGKSSILLSAIPGYSTHLEPKYASPCIDWEKIASLQAKILPS